MRETKLQQISSKEHNLHRQADRFRTRIFGDHIVPFDTKSYHLLEHDLYSNVDRNQTQFRFLDNLFDILLLQKPTLIQNKTIKHKISLITMNISMSFSSTIDGENNIIHNSCRLNSIVKANNKP